MQKIKQLIDEIAALKREPTHKSALRIYSLMENNKQLFEGIMDPNDLNYLVSGFENVSQKNPGDFNSSGGPDEYRKLLENLLFHCNRVV